MARLKFDAEDRQPIRLLPLQVDSKDLEAWLLAKEPRSIGWYNELGREEYARSFTAAQTAGTDVADDLYFGMIDVVARSGDQQDFEKLVIPVLKAKGWLGGDEGAIARRVRLIYDTNLRLGRAAGRWAAIQDTKDLYPYLRAFTVGDDRVRRPPESPDHDHTAWDGIILPVDHEFWTVYFPPLDFRCRCEVVGMSRSQLARYRGGVTSADDLAYRIQRIGPPVFAAPAAPIGVALGKMVERTNESLMPGMAPVSAGVTETRGRALWDALVASDGTEAVADSLLRLFGLAA